MTILIDGGGPSDGDAVADFVHTYANGVLHAVIGTHLDIDHIGGLKDVVERCIVQRFFLNRPPDLNRSLSTLLRQRLVEHKKSGSTWGMLERSLEAVKDLDTALKAKGLMPEPIVAGMGWNIGDVTLRVLNPNQDRLRGAWDELEGEESESAASMRELGKLLGIEIAPETTAENNASVVLELIYQRVPHALLTGDAGADVLREVTGGKAYSLLKVPHHGSKTGLDETLVAQLQPKTAYISVGDNSYGHPAREILEMLKHSGVKTLCSNKTSSCFSGCPADGFGSLCHRQDRAWHPGYTETDASKCVNNR
jgi:beta-lactamase superfamily II metal-dependent hydrolase